MPALQTFVARARPRGMRLIGDRGGWARLVGRDTCRRKWFAG